MKTIELSVQHGGTREAGFTLVELLIAAALFLVISGSAFALLRQHQPLFNQQQNLAALNISMRNAVSQLQLDIVNAGADFYTGINIPNWPVGVVITNHVVASGADCHTAVTYIYGTQCFDKLAVISADSSTPPANPSNSTGACMSTTSATTSTVYLSPSGGTGYATAALATAASAK